MATAAAAAASPLLVKVRHGPHTAGCKLLLGSASQVEAWAERAAALAAKGSGNGDGSGSCGSSSTSGSDGSSSDGSSSNGSGSNGSGSGEDGAAYQWCVDEILGGLGVSQASGGRGGAGLEGGGEYGLVLLDENDQGLAAGQYAVFYQDGVCLGAAKIMGALEGAGAPLRQGS